MSKTQEVKTEKQTPPPAAVDMALETFQPTGVVVSKQFKSFLSSDVPIEKASVPRLSLLQSNSEAVQVLGHPAGTFEHGLSHTNYGKKINLTPIRISFGALYMVKGEGRKNLKCKSPDGVTSIHGSKCAECPFGVYYKQWGKDGSKPKCSETVDFIAITDSMDPISITFRNTSFKEGKKLASALKFNQTLKSFDMTSVLEKNDEGTFFVPKVLGFQDIDQMQYEAACQWREQVSKGGVNIEDDSHE